jgi:hypothetical protein
MTATEKLVAVLQPAQDLVFDQSFSVELIDEKTGLVEVTLTLPAGTYLIYNNFDMDELGAIRHFVEDPNPSFNRLLRLPTQGDTPCVD